MDKPPVPAVPPDKLFDAFRDERKHTQTVAADSAKLMFQSVISSGENAVKSAMLINGGASVAVLAFLGNLMAKASPAIPLKLGEFPNAMLCFVFGALAPAVANGLIYATQFCFKRDWRKRGFFFNSLAIVCIVTAYALFAAGALIAWREFKRL